MNKGLVIGGAAQALLLLGMVSIATAADSPKRCVGVWGPGGDWVTVMDLTADKALIRWTQVGSVLALGNVLGRYPWEIPDSVLKPFGSVTFKPEMPFSAEAVSGSGMKADFTPREGGYNAHFHNGRQIDYNNIIFTCWSQPK